MLELAITGQQQQSFAVPVQSSCGIYVFHRNVIAECSSRAGKLAQNTVWLVKKNVTIAQAISLHDRMFLAGRKWVLTDQEHVDRVDGVDKVDGVFWRTLQ